MTAEKRYFIALLRSYVNQTAPVGEAVDSDELFRLADIHDVGGIIATQLKSVESQFQPTGELKSKFSQVLGYTVKNNAIREYAFEFIRGFLNENEIEHIFVKGIIIKEYYPNPELRTSGDIDVIVNCDLDRIESLARDNALNVTNVTDDTVTLKKNGLEIEIHNCADVISSYFDNIFSIAEKDGFEYSLGFNDHLFYLLCHLLKHVIYRGAGIRMLLDIDLMIRCGEYDYEKFIALCRANGLEKSARVILSLCKLWFDTPVESTVDLNEDVELLKKLEAVFIDGGSFGYSNNTIPLKYYRNNSNKFRILLNLAFPSKEYLKKCYAYYEKNPVLYPAARLNRLFDGVFKRRSLANKAVKQIMNGENTDIQLELINELEINNGEQK